MNNIFNVLLFSTTTATYQSAIVHVSQDKVSQRCSVTLYHKQTFTIELYLKVS